MYRWMCSCVIKRWSILVVGNDKSDFYFLDSNRLWAQSPTSLSKKRKTKVYVFVRYWCACAVSGFNKKELSEKGRCHGGQCNGMCVSTTNGHKF